MTVKMVNLLGQLEKKKKKLLGFQKKRYPFYLADVCRQEVSIKFLHI